MPTPFVVNAHSKEEKKDCMFNGWMEPQHFCIHSSMGEVVNDTTAVAKAVILKGTRDIGAIVGSRVANIYGLDILAEEIQVSRVRLVTMHGPKFSTITVTASPKVYKLPNEKEVVFGALDKWTAWETEFLVIAMSKALKILRKMGHWVPVIQTVKKLCTSAFLRVCGGLLQAKGQYLGEMRFNFSCKVRIQVIEGFDEMIFEVHNILA
ncbi:Pentatricopeptide repeat-containing protein, chloroplastic isoform B [Glycine soja]|uniref:Pentatricopeptide repeat-containing protein, chloroplastic isoform B n=1 Tax=Glycine soja TaxID=3848 RepID=A0A445I3N3_GLYSO|nr:Pentatricopeptide repeat-containing protein, chloroplastic isoform B [Glycine soja]